MVTQLLSPPPGDGEAEAVEGEQQAESTRAPWRDLPINEQRAQMLKKFQDLGGRHKRGALMGIVRLDGRNKKTVAEHLAAAEAEQRSSQNPLARIAGVTVKPR